MIKNLYKTAFIALAGMVASAQALEIRPYSEILFPAKVKISAEEFGNSFSYKVDSDPVYAGGAEVLVSPENIPIRFGGGLGVKSAQQKGSTVITPALLPLWGTITYDPIKDKYAVSPYIVARVGTAAPLTGNGNWWEKPLNFTVNGGIGVILPFNIGLEVVYDYTSILKSFKSIETKYRASSGRVGIVLSYGINIGSKNPKPAEEEPKGYDVSSITNENTSEEPAESQETSSFDYSGGAYDSSSETDSSSTTSETTDYGYGYGASEETPSESTADTAASETESTEPAAEESAPEESAAEEAPAEPEAVAEPEPEPEPEVAPEPKPAAKKATKKSSKKSKKSSKKSTKKSSKKSKKKK